MQSISALSFGPMFFGNDVTNLTSGTGVYFYCLENAQDTPSSMSGNTDATKKIPSNFSNGDLCTYLELKGIYTAANGRVSQNAYRVMLGGNNTNDVHVYGGRSYEVTLNLSAAGAEKQTWKSESNDVELVPFITTDKSANEFLMSDGTQTFSAYLVWRDENGDTTHYKGAVSSYNWTSSDEDIIKPSGKKTSSDEFSYGEDAGEVSIGVTVSFADRASLSTDYVILTNGTATENLNVTDDRTVTITTDFDATKASSGGYIYDDGVEHAITVSANYSGTFITTLEDEYGILTFKGGTTSQEDKIIKGESRVYYIVAEPGTLPLDEEFYLDAVDKVRPKKSASKTAEAHQLSFGVVPDSYMIVMTPASSSESGRRCGVTVTHPEGYTYTMSGYGDLQYTKTQVSSTQDRIEFYGTYSQFFNDHYMSPVSSNTEAEPSDFWDNTSMTKNVVKFLPSGGTSELSWCNVYFLKSSLGCYYTLDVDHMRVAIFNELGLSFKCALTFRDYVYPCLWDENGSYTNDGAQTGTYSFTAKPVWDLEESLFDYDDSYRGYFATGCNLDNLFYGLSGEIEKATANLNVTCVEVPELRVKLGEYRLEYRKKTGYLVNNTTLRVTPPQTSQYAAGSAYLYCPSYVGKSLTNVQTTLRSKHLAWYVNGEPDLIVYENE